MGISVLRPFLQNLCCNSPWNYAVFWSRKNQHENVLSWEDGFCNFENPKISAVRKVEDFQFEDSNEILLSTFRPSGNFCNYPIELAVAEMSSTCHVIGNGLVGEVALTRQARWIYAGYFNPDLHSECPDEWLLQFAEGIKTILLFPVGPYGVLQLGSSEMVVEDTALPSHVEDLSACFENCWLPDWRNVISELELSMVFNFMDSSEEPANFTTENLVGGHFVSPKNQIDIVEPYLLSHEAQQDIGSVVRYEEMVMTSLFSEDIDFGMQGIAASDLEDMSLVAGGIEQAICGFSFDNDDTYETGSNFFTFPEECELRNEPQAFDSLVFPANNAEMKAILSANVINASSSVDGSSSCKSSITILNAPEAKPSVTSSWRRDSPVPKEDTWSLATSELATSCFSPLVSSVERRKGNMLPIKQEQRKSCHSSNRERVKVSRLSRANKRKGCSDDDQNMKPRDRKLTQDRMKELRELVPNSDKCSIDGLLDKTIKHMLFLKSVTDQADKLRKHEAEGKEAMSDKTDNRHQNGASWAVEIGNANQQNCPIAVKDLNQPGHLLIEMACENHDRFLEIADVIHRLQLTVLKGVMDKSSGSILARFIVTFQKVSIGLTYSGH